MASNDKPSNDKPSGASTDTAPADTLFVRGLAAGASEAEIIEAIKQLFFEASDDCAWLEPGDRVLVKLALNSPDPYPSTTSPLSLRAVVQALRERGADVVVGDMPGLEYVLLDEHGSHKRSARYCYEQAGTGAGLEMEFAGFEERGWSEGFTHFAHPGAECWPRGFHLTRWADEVDHIVSLPRLSTHTQAGVTLGYKLAVGYLRQDSRMEFHADGPFYSNMKGYVRGTALPTRFEDTDRFFERIVEIHLALRPKQRVTLIDGRQAQITLGPDRKVSDLGLSTRQVTPDPALLFASANHLAVEVFGIAALTHLYREHAGCKDRLLQKLMMLLNTQQAELGKASPWEHRFVRHALALELDSADFHTRWRDVPDPLRAALDLLLARS